MHVLDHIPEYVYENDFIQQKAQFFVFMFTDTKILNANFNLEEDAETAKDISRENLICGEKQVIKISHLHDKSKAV